MTVHRGHWRTRLSLGLLALYLLASLPVMAVFVKSEYVRFVFLETVAHWYGKLRPIEYVFIGDSLTAGGRNWGIRLTGSPLSARNLAVSGYTTHQVHELVKSALTYRPRYVAVAAGTNDVLELQNAVTDPESARTQLHLVAREYESMLDEIICGGATPIVTLVPYTNNAATNELIAPLNSQIRNAGNARNLPEIDINSRIAPKGTLQKQYSLDGVHLSPSAYDVWGQELRNAVQRWPGTSRPASASPCTK